MLKLWLPAQAEAQAPALKPAENRQGQGDPAGIEHLPVPILVAFRSRQAASDPVGGLGPVNAAVQKMVDVRTPQADLLARPGELGVPLGRLQLRQRQDHHRGCRQQPAHLHGQYQFNDGFRLNILQDGDQNRQTYQGPADDPGFYFGLTPITAGVNFGGAHF